MHLTPFSFPLASSDPIQIREVRPSDARLLQVGFKKLSDQSRAFRFLAAHPRLTALEIESFTAPNDVDHFAIGAVTTNGSDVKPIGIARYIRLHGDALRAEFAVTIIDEYHGLGLGSLMLGVLAKHAVDNGISAFVALVQEKNERMLNLLDELGAEAVTTDAPEIEFRLPLHGDARAYPDTAAGDAFRTAYRLARIVPDDSTEADTPMK